MAAEVRLLAPAPDSADVRGMQVYLDGRLLTSDGTSLASALDSARSAAGSRLVIEVLADGMSVPDGDLSNPPGRSPYAGRLEIRTTDRELLLRSVFDEASDLLSDVQARQKRAAACVQAGQLTEALTTIREALGGWATIRQALELADQAGPADGVRAALPGVLADLASQLGAVKRAIGSQDWSDLGDVLEYDLHATADRCRGWLKEVAGQNA